jgi:hypothetical protein
VLTHLVGCDSEALPCWDLRCFSITTNWTPICQGCAATESEGNGRPDYSSMQRDGTTEREALSNAGPQPPFPNRIQTSQPDYGVKYLSLATITSWTSPFRPTWSSSGQTNLLCILLSDGLQKWKASVAASNRPVSRHPFHHGQSVGQFMSWRLSGITLRRSAGTHVVCSLDREPLQEWPDFIGGFWVLGETSVLLVAPQEPRNALGSALSLFRRKPSFHSYLVLKFALLIDPILLVPVH